MEAKASGASTVKSKPLDLGKSKENGDEMSLGRCAYRIVDRQSKQIAKLRSPVLKDADAEPLHQMRIGTRKLRSALTLFSDVVKVDSKGKKSGLSKLTKSLKNLTQTLGNVRDLDVMQQWFEQALADYGDYGTSSSKKKVKKAAEKKSERVAKGDRAFSTAETETIQTLLKQLKKRRKEAFLALKESLKGKDYEKLISRCKQWVKQPAFTATAQQTAHYGAAQKIVAPIAALMEHPGWLVATRQQPNQKGIQTIVPVANITLAKINQQLAKEGEQLHDLRKQVKRVRYQTEFFRGIYGTAYAAQIREFRDLQAILGELQDQIVISQFLTDALGSDWAQQLPTIEAAFQAARLDLWAQWQPYQQKYLKLRSGLLAAPQAA